MWQGPAIPRKLALPRRASGTLGRFSRAFSARAEEGAKSMLGETTIISLTPAATFQPLGESEGAVVLMTDSGQLYTCNDTTVALLQALDGVRSFGSIVDELLDEFDVEREVLAADLSKLVGELEREGIVAVAMGTA
jgi:pyrroloquinoline quinone biosynthesis protein D